MEEKMKVVNYLKKSTAAVLSLSMAVSLLNTGFINAGTNDDNGIYLLSENRPAYSSSVNGGDVASFATDGKLSTQWGSAANINDQWLDVDLGKTANISKVEIDWQNNASYGVVYDILTSDDEINWRKIYSTEEGNGGVVTNVMSKDGQNVDYSYLKEELTGLEGTGRYVRVFVKYSKSQYDNGEKMGWGASIRELKVYGTGGVNKPDPDSFGENLARGKNVTVSSAMNPWWANAPLAGENSVDADYDTYWLSEGNHDEWYVVDLGRIYEIGKVIIQWQVEYGRIYDLQTSTDGVNYTTVYRQLNGNGEDEDIDLYVNARYIKMKGISMGRGSGYSIREMKVYKYVEGDPKQNQVVPNLPEEQVVNLGKGSYGIDDTNLYQPRIPKYITNKVTTPIPSNDWWTSVIYTRLSDTMPALPFVYRYTENGLAMYYADKTYTRVNNGGMGADSKLFDLTVGTTEIVGTGAARYDESSDWSTSIVFSDDDTEKMKSTIIKGSPYVYNIFKNPSSVEVMLGNLVKFFNNNGEVELADGVEYITDKLGVEIKNESESPEDEDRTQYHFYGLFFPENTKVVRIGSKLKIILGGNNNYMSIAALSKESEFDYMYQHAYAFVKSTNVTYEFDQNNSNMTTHYNVTTEVKRNGFSDKTIMCMFPTQWKYSDTATNGKTYNSIRGTLKCVEGNHFSYGLKFNGIVPAFNEPVESSYYNREEMIKYLNEFADSATRDYWVADPYWQGKKTHPIAMGILIAEQLEQYELRDQLISILRKILVNWYTYEGTEEYPYYLYYHTSWGAISGDGGDHGMAINLSDHHFLWAYFIFPSAVLASYDKEFVRDYGDMVELLIRDCMNPDKDDDLLPFMRNFDPYEGHSWAGGYGDNNSGNNQESASEATFAWAGLYLWGLVTGNDKYRDAGIWGFTSEVNAIEQYWFNYDGDCWDEDYTEGCVGMVWGLGYTNGTYFSGNPSCIYGIHMLPVTPAIDYMGYDHEKAGEIYEKYEDSQRRYQEKLITEGAVDPEGWFHILWPYLALSNPEEAARRWNNEIATHTNENGVYVDGNLPNDEKFNSYWYIQNMCAKGYVSTKIHSDNYSCCQFFEKNGKYTATVWNPFDEVITVSFKDGNTKIGQTKVAPHCLVSVNPYSNTDKSKMTNKAVEEVDPIHNIPGVIEAEDYYTNFSCMKDTNDIEGGYIGWIDDGDSLIYDTNVEDDGEYTVEYRFISTSDEKTGVITLSSDIDGKIKTTTLNRTKSWNNVSDTIALKAGRQKLKLRFDVAGFNLSYIKIYKKGTKPPIADSDDLTKADLSAYSEIDLSNATVTASNEIGWNYAANIIDKDYNSRWETESADPQWIMIELPEAKVLEGIKIYWEGAAAKNYSIETSLDGNNFNEVFSRKNGTGGSGYGDENRGSGLESIEFNKAAKAKYIKIIGTTRLTGYGYSIFEVRVFGGESSNSNITVSDKVEINGLQISYTGKGVRCLYSSANSIDGKDVVERGMVYSLTSEVPNEDDVYVREDMDFVKYFASTNAGISSVNRSNIENSQTRIMTMLFGTGTKEEFLEEYGVRSYVKLSDGTYRYSELRKYTVYNLAAYLYEGKLMPTVEGHNYLYNSILRVANSNYKEVLYYYNGQ
ncbi:MAG: carbohydrate-binding protein [Lachnospiraceae bacterium]|nr:carbohydrate-binding protein [Lachnospiraceae bacterium]